MATKEEINSILKRFYESMPRPFITKMEKSNIGVGMALRYLAEVGRPVSAAEISRYMNVSTARMAVLLRTMTEKELIVKSDDSSDARKIRVSLSEKGREHIIKVKGEIEELMTEIVNKVGVERMEIFLDISNEINVAVSTKLAEKKT